MIEENGLIYLDKVSKIYTAGAPALNGVTLHINRGEFVFVVGDSGSGKSTLIKLLLRELIPTKGKVWVMGHDVAKLSHWKIPKFRRNLGIVFQDFRLLPDRNVYENVEFALRLAKNKRQIRKNLTDMDNDIGDAKNDVINENTHDRVSELLERVGLSKRMDHMPDQLSGGEQQRVAIARAVVHCPKVVFADEPTGALDTAAGFEVMRLFRELIDDEDITIVMTTHDPNLMELGDEVFELSDGIVI